MRLSVLGVCATLSTVLLAQSALPKFVADPQRVAKDVVDDQSKDYHLRDRDGAKLPRRVALVSFFTFDPGLTKSYTWETTTHYGRTTIKRSSAGSSGPLAVALYGQGLEAMQAAFREHGVELLEPETFLDTDARKADYRAFKVAHDGMSNWVNKMGSGGHETMYGLPEGFIVADIVAEPFANYSVGGGIFAAFKGIGYSRKAPDKQLRFYENDTRMMTSLGFDLAGKLGVDAVLVVYATIYSPADGKVVLQNVTFGLFGPNPLQLEPGKSRMFYSRGLWYSGTRLTVGVPVVQIDPKQPGTRQIDPTGFEVIASKMSHRLLESLERELNVKK
jgi:hypothetical protein